MNIEYIYFSKLLNQLVTYNLSNKDLNKICKKNINVTVTDIAKLADKYDLRIELQDNLEWKVSKYKPKYEE